MDNVLEINDRILLLVQMFTEGNKRKFSRKIGLSSSAVLENIVGKRKSKPSFEVIQMILLSFENVSPDWLILGKGNLYRQEITDNCPNCENNKKDLTNCLERLKDKEALINSYEMLLNMRKSEPLNKQTG